MASWPVDGVDDPIGMSELQEQAITSMANPNDRKVINTFLVGFIILSFVKKKSLASELLYNIYGEFILPVL